jgi:hypothetical protein
MIIKEFGIGAKQPSWLKGVTGVLGGGELSRSAYARFVLAAQPRRNRRKAPRGSAGKKK